MLRSLLPCLLIMCSVPTVAEATPVIHAHRGGALAFGKPVLPEDAMPAFRNAALTPGVWLELDAVVSSDGIPFVIHDSTLDRTTDCTGNVLDLPAAKIETCRIDKIGVAGVVADAPATPVVRVPRLAEVLAFAKERGLSVNIEIKRIPGDPGYLPGDESFATAVTEVIKAAALPAEHVIIQSFDPTNLDTAHRILPDVELSFLTLAQVNDAGPAFAAARGYQWVSPGGVPSAAYMSQARALGLKVIPYTLDTPDEVRAAAAAGVDALITDDVPMARQALGLEPIPPTSEPPAAPATTTPSAASGVTIIRRSLAQVLRRRGFTVLLRAPRAARATVRFKLGSVVVAGGGLHLAEGGRRVGIVRLSRAGRVLLRARRRARVTVSIVLDGRRLPARVLTLR